MIFNSPLAALVVALVTSVGLVQGVDETRDPELVAKLKTAATHRDQRLLLNNDADWLFEFPTQDKYTFAPGGVINANAATFPATVGNGMTMAVLNLGPCSMLPPHWHPRASNFVYAVHGTTATFMISENGAGVVKQTLTPGKMTIFPHASLHMMMNIGCTNAQLVSALNAEDTGTLNLGYGLQNLQELLVNAAMGYQPLSTNSSRAAIPLVGTGSNLGPKECLAKCAAQTGAESAGVGGTEGAQCGPPVPRTAGEAEVDAGNLFDIGV